MFATFPSTLFTTRYLGSVYAPKKDGREILPLVCNETPSFIPSMFFDPDKKGPCIQSVQELFYKVMPSMTLKSDEAFIQRLIVEIQDHAENRLQLIFQQFLMVYKTNLDFSYSGKALHQAGLKNEQPCSNLLQEAHSSTLPCLLVLREGAQNVFGSDTSFYHAQNMTVKVPKETNAVDSWIDRNVKEFKGVSLRDEACQLIQELSKSKIDPKAALKAFVEKFLLRLDKFKSTHQGPKELLSCQFYTRVASSYKTQLNQDDALLKSLCFERNRIKAIDDTFFLCVQATLHERLYIDLRAAEQREKLFIARPISNTQNMYAKIYLNAPKLILLLGNYFRKLMEEDRDQLITDWKKIVHVTPKKQNGISSELIAVINETTTLIKTIYQIKNIQHLGAIMASMLYQASISLDPDANALYTLPEVANRGPITRSVTQNMDNLLPFVPRPILIIVQDSIPLAPRPILTSAQGPNVEQERIRILPILTKTQKDYYNTFLQSAHIRTLLENYFKGYSKQMIDEDLKIVHTITATETSSLSPLLRNIFAECLKLISKKPQKMGQIVAHLLDYAAPK